MSLRIDNTEWISGALVIGDTGGGVLAQNLALTGDNGAGYLSDDVTLPADNGKEICGRIITWPAGLSLFAYEDGSVIASAADGIYTAQYQLYVDYVPTGSPTNLTFTFGEVGVSLTASWVEGSESVAVSGDIAIAGVAASASWVEGSETTAILANFVGLPGSVSGAASWVEGSESVAITLALETFYVRAPSGSGYAPRIEYSIRPEQINTTRH